MSLLGKQRKDLLIIQLTSCSYRSENTMVNWNLEAYLLQQRGELDDFDSELDYAMTDGRCNEVNLEQSLQRGKVLKVYDRVLS